MRKDGRIQIRVPEELKRWVQDYVEKNHTDISALITRFLVRLKTEEENKPVDAEQI